MKQLATGWAVVRDKKLIFDGNDSKAYATYDKEGFAIVCRDEIARLYPDENYKVVEVRITEIPKRTKRGKI